MNFYDIKKWLNYKYSTDKYSKRLYIVENIYDYIIFKLKDIEYEIDNEDSFYLDLLNYILKYSFLDKNINIEIKLDKNYNENINDLFIDDLYFDLENYIYSNNIQILNKNSNNKINDFYNLIINNFLIPNYNNIEDDENSDNDFIYVD